MKLFDFFESRDMCNVCGQTPCNCTHLTESVANPGRRLIGLFNLIYRNGGDDAVDYLLYNSPIFADYYDQYEGDLESIAAEVGPKELAVMVDELEEVAENEGLAEGSLEEVDRRGFLKGLGAAAVGALAVSASTGAKADWLGPFKSTDRMTDITTTKWENESTDKNAYLGLAQTPDGYSVPTIMVTGPLKFSYPPEAIVFQDDKGTIWSEGNRPYPNGRIRIDDNQVMPCQFGFGTPTNCVILTNIKGGGRQLSNLIAGAKQRILIDVSSVCKIGILEFRVQQQTKESVEQGVAENSNDTTEIAQELDDVLSQGVDYVKAVKLIAKKYNTHPEYVVRAYEEWGNFEHDDTFDLREQGVAEGVGNFAKAIGNLHGWGQVNSNNPDVEIYEFDDREGGFYAEGTVYHNTKTGRVKIEFEDKMGEYGGMNVNDTFNSIGDAMNVLRQITIPIRQNTGKAQNFDRLGGREVAGPNDVYKTDRAGKKGTLTKSRMDTMKMSSPYRKTGPKGVLPEQGVAEGLNDTVYPNAEVIKSKNGKPVGEIYQDGNKWGCFHYKADRGYDMIDSREDAIQALKDLHSETGRSRPDYTIKGVAEMDKSQPSHGRDGKISHSTYGSRDKQSTVGGKEHTARATTADKMMRDAHDAMMKSMSAADKVKKGWRNPKVSESFSKGLNLEPMGSTLGRDIQRQQGLRPSGPQRLFSELADMLHISVGTLTQLSRRIPGFPEVRGRGTASQGNKGYYDLAAFKKWVIDNQVREKIKSLKQNVKEGLGQDIDYTSLEVDGIHSWDSPDYSDAYFSYGEYIDGTPLPDDVLDQLSSNGELLHKYIQNKLYEGPVTPVAPMTNPAKVQVQPKQNVHIPTKGGGSGGAPNIGKKSPAAIIDIQTPPVSEDDDKLVDFIYSELEKQFPDVVSKFGHEVVGDAIADTAVFYKDAKAEDITAMVQQVVNTLQHRTNSLSENRLYYNTIGTPGAHLRKEFKMRKDKNGWFLKEDADSLIKLEALRAFGSPRLQEYDLSAFSGSTQVQGSDNVVSPVGSVPKSQRKKAKQNG